MSNPSTKVCFRARAVDPNKRLPIRIRKKCRNRSPKVKRAVAVPPSGMEKEEESESHLQKAIIAQKATSAGDSVSNHVIPTPKVYHIENDAYERIYQPKIPRNKHLIKFQDIVPFFVNQCVYNADSEDEEWLSSRSHITVDEFEQIIEILDTSSQSGIIQPRQARSILQKYDPGIVDDVYDYWLQKRKQALSKNNKCSVLIPRCHLESRRDDKSVLNPYIAFRRRLDKVQTRKKQKTEIMTYEKILRLNFTLKRSMVLADMVMQRERLKMILVDCEQSVFHHRCQLQDSGKDDLIKTEEISGLESILLKQDSQLDRRFPSENGRLTLFPNPMTFLSSSIGKRPLLRTKIGLNPIDFNISKSELESRNTEIWNSATPLPTNLQTDLRSDNLEVEKVAEYNVSSSVDGRYMFRRKLGCQYRFPHSIPNELCKLEGHTFAKLSPAFQPFSQWAVRNICVQDRFKHLGLVRKRIGRGGRTAVDAFTGSHLLN